MCIPDEGINTTHLKQLILSLQSTRQTVMCYFGVWKVFVSKLDIYTPDIRTATFRYLKHMRSFAVDHRVNAVEIEI